MKTAPPPVDQLGKVERLPMVEDWGDEFAAESSYESSPVVLDELKRRAAWRDLYPGQAKNLRAIANALGVHL